MSYKMFIDDIRFPTTDDFVVVRSVEEGIDCIKTKGMPDFISFDHDLGDNVPTGKDFANWLIEQDLDGTFEIQKTFDFYVHSANPVGKENIEGLLNGYLKHKFAPIKMKL